MINEALSTQLSNLVSTAQNLIVVLDSTATFDQVAAAIALTQSLDQAGKEVRLATVKKLPGVDQLSETERLNTELGHQSLTISFDYSQEKVDKISYHIGEEAGKFYLTVKPKAGIQPLDPKTVEYTYTGAEADLLILIGVSDLEDLEQLYFGYEEFYRNTTIISINGFEPDFATIKLDTSSSAATSEFVVGFLEKLNLPISADAATNLLAGIEQNTSRLQSRSMTAESFQVVAKLLNLGARRVLAPILASGSFQSGLGEVVKSPTEKSVAKSEQVLVETKTQPTKKPQNHNPSNKPKTRAVSKS